MLEDQLNLIQGMIKHDSTRWEIKHGTNFEEEIRHIFNQNEPDKPRNLAYVVNDQLHDIRDDIITLEEERRFFYILLLSILTISLKPALVSSNRISTGSDLACTNGISTTLAFFFSSSSRVMMLSLS
jgi:hypothetical protein